MPRSEAKAWKSGSAAEIFSQKRHLPTMSHSVKLGESPLPRNTAGRNSYAFFLRYVFTADESTQGRTARVERVSGTAMPALYVLVQ